MQGISKVLSDFRKESYRKKQWKKTYLDGVRFFRDKEFKVHETSVVHNDRIGILITPWIGLSVACYAITLAFTLYYYGYTNIAFVVNDLWDDYTLFSGCKRQCDYIKKIIELISTKQAGIDLIYFSDIKTSTCNSDLENIIAKYAELNTIKYVGNSIKDSMFFEIESKWIDYFNKIIPVIDRLSNQEWHSFVIPGGLFQESGLFFEIFTSKKKNIITYDSGVGRYKIGINSYAAQNGNTYDSVCRIKSNYSDYSMAVGEAKKILDNRMNMKPELSLVGKGKIIQTTPIDDTNELSYDIVLFTNLEFDTAALDTHRVFQNDYDWIKNTIDFVIENTKATIAIRQHPLKRQFLNLVTTDKKLKEEYEGNQRIRFIDYDEKISSYALLKNAYCVIVNTSTIGLESGMLGIPVVSESASYYHKSSFVDYAKSYDEYTECILKYLEEKKRHNSYFKEEACLYYYMTQRCSSVLTVFTPQPDDFTRWINMDLNTVIELPELKYIIGAITKFEAVDYQVFVDLMKEYNYESV